MLASQDKREQLELIVRRSLLGLRGFVQVAGSVERRRPQAAPQGHAPGRGFAQAKHVRIKSRKKNATILEMVLDEGRNREIRRLLARIGHKVQRLTRIAVGPVRLGDMPPGAVRLLTKQEIAALREAIAAGPRKKTAPQACSTQSANPPPTEEKPVHRGHGDRREAADRSSGAETS